MGGRKLPQVVPTAGQPGWILIAGQPGGISGRLATSRLAAVISPFSVYYHDRHCFNTVVTLRISDPFPARDIGVISGRRDTACYPWLLSATRWSRLDPAKFSGLFDLDMAQRARHTDP